MQLISYFCMHPSFKCTIYLITWPWPIRKIFDVHERLPYLKCNINVYWYIYHHPTSILTPKMVHISSSYHNSYPKKWYIYHHPTTILTPNNEDKSNYSLKKQIWFRGCNNSLLILHKVKKRKIHFLRHILKIFQILRGLALGVRVSRPYPLPWG